MATLLHLLFPLTILHAAYIIQLSFRQPSPKHISQQTESLPLWLLASGPTTLLARLTVVLLCTHHAILSLLLSNSIPNSETLLRKTCPSTKYLDKSMFTWSSATCLSLAVLYAGCWIRFAAYAALGTNFTYRLSKPDKLVTNGVYTYVRHPSYTGLILVLGAAYALVGRSGGVLGCWVENVFPGEWAEWVMSERVGVMVPVMGFCLGVGLLVGRVRDEEKLMERAFGEEWRRFCRGRKRFVPGLI